MTYQTLTDIKSGALIHTTSCLGFSDGMIDAIRDYYNCSNDCVSYLETDEGDELICVGCVEVARIGIRK